jgi:hypothetical protein
MLTSLYVPCSDGCKHLEVPVEHQVNYAHSVEIHDVGAYRFKGISHNFNIKSVNLEALTGRNESYKGDLKATKAKKMAEGIGFERVCCSDTSKRAYLTSRIMPACFWKTWCWANTVHCIWAQQLVADH